MSRNQIVRLLNELMRRKVVRVTIGYAVVMWLLLQIAEVTFEPLKLPDWAMTFLVVIAILGFAIAATLAWAFEVSPEGLKRDPQDEARNNPDVADSVANNSAYRSVAVLPFVDMSSGKNQGYFCDGIADEVLGLLSTVKCLHVTSRTSSFRFKDKDLGIREIGRALNVEAILEGSLRKEGDRVRISAQLIGVPDGYHIWGSTYDQVLTAAIDIQRDVARDIVRQICESLNLEELAFPEPVALEDIRAHDYYFQGRHFLKRRTERNVNLAAGMFSKAVELDPKMSLGWAGLTEALTYLYLHCEGNEEYRRRAVDASRKAIKLAADSAPCRTARGMALLIEGRPAEADFEFRAALSMNPLQFSASYYYARSRQAQGDLGNAAEIFERASRCQPENYEPPLLALSVYRRLGMQTEAREVARRGTAAATVHLSLHPDDVRALYLGCLGHLELDDAETGRQWAERAVALDPVDGLLRYNIACFYARLGEIDLALANLSIANLRAADFAGWIDEDPDLAPLRGSQRFAVLRQGLRHAVAR